MVHLFGLEKSGSKILSFIELALKFIRIHFQDEDNNDGNSSASGNFPVKKFWMKNFLQNVLLERFNNITKLFR